MTPEGEKKKTCTKCGMVKVLSLFKRDNAKKDGSSQPCRECGKKARLQRYYTRHEHFLKARRVYSQNHKKRQLEKTLESKKRYPEKEKARWMLREAVKRGKLERLPCEICKVPNAQGHHEDYSKPLDVIWLCQTHHGERHRTKSYGHPPLRA